MSVVIIALGFAATVFAAEVPAWFDGHLALVAFVAMRAERAHVLPLVLLLVFLRATASLDPTALHVVAGAGIGVAVLVARRWLFASRLVNQMVITFAVVATMELVSAVAITRAYPTVGVLSLWRPGLQSGALTALLAPLLFAALDHGLLRPRMLRHGLLPVTGA